MISHSKPHITNNDIDAVNTVLLSKMIAEGSLVKDFEDAVSQYLGLKGGVATTTGTDALYLALKVLNIGSEDEVIIPTYVCKSVWDAVQQTGANPVFCDVGENWCMNVDTIKPHISKKTKAIIVVHIFGIAADIEQICDLGVTVIEDCCQAFGAKIGNRALGTFGELCVLSFHATKLLATGEGGMILSNNQTLLNNIRFFKNGSSHGLNIRYRSPMTDMQAALGLSQLKKYQLFLGRRKSIADLYFEKLEDLPVKLPINIRQRSIFFRFPVRIKTNFDKLRVLFDSAGIQVRRGVDTLLHEQAEEPIGSFPIAEILFNETVSLPIYPALTDLELRKIINCCSKILL